MCEGWMIQIKSCVWHNLLKAYFVSHTITMMHWNSQTKCVKNEWFRSSLVFDIISLKQISPLTQLLWCFETHRHLPPKIKWSTVWRKSTQGPCSTNYSMSLSLSLTQMNAQNIFSLQEFLQNCFFMNERLWKYTLLNRHIIS